MNLPLPARGVVASLTTLTLLWACTGGDGPTEPAPTPTIAISVAPTSLSVEQASAGSATVTLTRGGGFNGTVTLSAQGLPTGVSASSQTVAAGAGSATLDFQVSPSATPGTTSVTIRASGSGVQDATATLSLVVTARPTGGFTLSVAPASLSVEQGTSASATVTVTRESPFSGAVALAVTGAPAGVTVSASPASVTGGSSTLTVTVAEGAATGSSTLTVTGTGSGVESRSVTLALTVTPRPTGSFSLALGASARSVERGKSGTVSVTIARVPPFSGAVQLAVTGAPAGVTVSVDPATVTGTSATLSISVADSAVAGTSTLTVTGTAEGVPTVTATLALTVTDPAPTGGFSLAVAPGALSVEQGADGTATVRVTRQSPFTGAVALTVTGAPTGVTASFSPASVSDSTSTLTLAVDGSAAVGTATLTIQGTGTGVAAQSTTLGLTVTQKATGGFSLSVSPATLSVQQGQSGTATVSVARQSPFAGAVTLAVSGAPSGVTATLDPASVTGSSATLTLAVGSGAATGDATVTISGTGAGVGAQSTTLVLSVTAKPAGTSHTWNFCPSTPVWFAVKDGDAAWTAVTPSGSSVTFSASSDKVGVAWVTTGSASSELNMRFATQAELAELGSGLCRGGRTVTGTVPGLGAADQAWVSMGSATAVVVGAQGNAFTLSNLKDGTVDLFAARNAFDLGSFSFRLDKLFLQRGLNPANNGAVTVDFNGANAFAPVTHNVTATGLDGDPAIVTMLYVTSGNTGIMTQTTNYSAAATRTFPAMPADRQQSGDYHLLQLTTQPDGANNVLGSYRAASVYFQAPGDRTVAFGADLGTTTITTASTAPYVRPRVQYARQAEYNRYWYGAYQQSAGGTSRNLVFYITDDYQGNGDIDFTVPDFSGVAGWNNAWGLSAGSQITYNFTTSGWDGSGSIGPSTLAAGLQIKTATRSGQINP